MEMRRRRRREKKKERRKQGREGSEINSKI